MSTRKIRDLAPDESCRHPEHEPPNCMLYAAGVYEHICPACLKKTVFTVRGVRCQARWGGPAGPRLWARR